MKCPKYDLAKAKRNMERGSPEKPLALHVKDSPIKDPLPLKPLAQRVSTVLFPNSLVAARDKENRTLKVDERTFDEAFNDSGYLSLHNSRIDDDDNHGQGKNPHIPFPFPPLCVTPKLSPPCQEGTVSDCLVSLGASSIPVDRCRRNPHVLALSSTPAEQHCEPNLPIRKFQQAVCQELSKSYSKNKRYDWSVVSEVAKDYQLHQVIGGGMGSDFVDVFASLLSKNMRNILANILALLGDMDLISCKKVSRTWRKIVREDGAALRRCRQAEKTLQESLSYAKVKTCDLTRNAAGSRVVMSCIQKVASPRPPSSSSSASTGGGVNRRAAAPAQKHDGKSQSRFNEYRQAAGTLKQDESLRRCRECGSPATHSDKSQRATCTRPSCKFDFCTLCQEAFHGSAPCRVACCTTRLPAPRSSYSVLPGSARSKRNVRRL
ncbi:F-box only protein 5 [Syngnathoides biaculeatus]|uniref:F-box only protein 5 n=1 Tax=Syngnathoides biaculeatus TaxID=300417 RepID=UPI002ADE9441|nr:F-box only protein 5 [Syngnathoides biaculeatus]